MSRIKDFNLVLTGSFLIGVALLAFYLAAPLSTMTDVGMGPGYVPRLFAFMQLGLGGLMVFNGFLQDGEPSQPWHLRPLLLVLASVSYFAMTIERLGLVVAVIGLVLISSAAHRGNTWRDAVLLALGCAAFAAIVFVKLLKLSMALWPPGFGGR